MNRRKYLIFITFIVVWYCLDLKCTFKKEKDCNKTLDYCSMLGADQQFVNYDKKSKSYIDDKKKDMQSFIEILIYCLNKQNFVIYLP